MKHEVLQIETIGSKSSVLEQFLILLLSIEMPQLLICPVCDSKTQKMVQMDYIVALEKTFTKCLTDENQSL